MEAGDEQLSSLVQPRQQQEPVADEPVVQARLTMGAPGDPYEREADAMADQVVQRRFAAPASTGSAPEVQAKCSACSDDDKQVQRQADPGRTCEEMLQAKSEGSLDVPPSVQHSLEGGVGGGAAMQSPVREEMESAFQTDFSGVRIHTGSTADGLNQDLNAQAFTYGKDIYFSSGQYDPGSPSGQHLLAHELTHVVQQNPGLQRKAHPAPGSSSPVHTVSGKKLQANVWTFGPPSGKYFPGTKIHNDVLPLFAEANKDDLFIEVTIPGATKKDVDTGRRGIADFYKAKPASRDNEKRSRTIGINFSEDGPTFLTPSSRLEGGKKYSHAEHSAPRGGKHKPRVRGTAQASQFISLGDLKPGNSAESYLGTAQLTNYKEGIANTASSVNSWLAEPANADQSEQKTKWNPTVSDLAPDSIRIPKQLDLKNPTEGLYPFELAVYKDDKMVDLKSGLKGAMFVYPHHVPGIWAYEWLPRSIPDTAASGNVDKTLTRLEEEVIEPVKSTGVSQAPVRRSVRRRERAKLRRKGGAFPLASWQKSYDKWKGDAQKSMAGKKEEQGEQLAEALLGVEKRTGGKVKLPAKVKQRARGYHKIRHWMKFGRIYGWLRNTFDGAYVKLRKFADKIKTKVKNLVRRAGSTSFGSWVKAAIKVVFKIFKMVAAWTVSQVVDKLMDSLQRGITNNINKAIEAFTPEGVRSKIEEFEAKKAEYEALIKETQETLEKKFFGDKLELLEKLEKWEWIADKVGTVATLVEWGVRLLACAAPPAIGCLWNLFISALQAAFAMLLQTCWFTKKVYAPVMNAISDVREFPTTVAKFVVEEANKYIKVPDGMDPLFDKIEIRNSDIPVECDENSGRGGPKLTEEQEKLLEMVQEMGVAKFCALLAVMKKRGAGPWVLLTADRLAKLQTSLENVTAKQLKDAAEAPDSKVPAPIEEFLESVSKYTPREKELIKQAAEEKKRKAEGKDGGDGKAAGDAKGSGDGKGAGGKGDGDATHKAPIDKQPGKKLDVTVMRLFAIVTFLPEPIKVGGKYPKEMDVFAMIVVKGPDAQGKAEVYPVPVRLKSVQADRVEFTNVKRFFAFYTSDHWIEIAKDELIIVPYDRLLNEETK